MAMADILFTHDDLDGVGCAVIYRLAHMDENDGNHYVHFCSNNEIDSLVLRSLEDGDIDENTNVMFTDICPSKKVLQAVRNKVKWSSQLTVIDHHRTNMFAYDVDISSNSMIHEFERSKDGRRVKSSGTSLLAEHYVNYLEQGRALMEFVEAVRSWDTYDWKINGNPLSRKLKAVLDAYGKKKLIQNMSTVIYEHPNDEIILDTSLVLYELELEKRYIEEVLNQNSIFPGKYKGHNIAFYVTTNAKYVSEVSYQFLEKNLDIDVFITVDLGRETVTYVTQSDDIDTAAIFAVPLGGGGHPKSSGSPLPFSFVKGLSTLLIKTWNVQI